MTPERADQMLHDYKTFLGRCNYLEKLIEGFLLMDTPGVLPMNYENVKKAANLALIGAIREDILPNEQLGEMLISYLKEH